MSSTGYVMSQSKIDQMQEMVDKGFSLRYITETLAVSANSVRKYCTENFAVPGFDFGEDFLLKNLYTLRILRKKAPVFVVIADEINSGKPIPTIRNESFFSLSTLKSWKNLLEKHPWALPYLRAYCEHMQFDLPTVEHIRTVVNENRCPSDIFGTEAAAGALGPQKRQPKQEKPKRRNRQAPRPVPDATASLDEQINALRREARTRLISFSEIIFIDKQIAESRKTLDKVYY